MFRAVLLILVLCVVGAAAVWTFRSNPSVNRHDERGECLLTGDARVVESMGDLVVQPPVNEEWTDVTLTLRGQGSGGVNAGQPTGPFMLKRPIVQGRTALKMETFQKPSGEHWVSMVMRPTDLEVVATLRGEQCRLTKSF